MTESTATAATDVAAGGGEPAQLEYVTAPLAQRHPTALHSGIRLGRYYGMHAMSAVFPMAAGVALYGWRALGVVAVVLGTALIATACWRRVGRRGVQLHYSQVMWMACLLALSLPPHLLSTSLGRAAPLWPIVPAAAVAMVALTWLLGGAGSARLHPVVLTFLLLLVFFRSDMVPHGVLGQSTLFLGDVTDTVTPMGGPGEAVKWSWSETDAPAGHAAVWRQPAFQRLVPFTTGVQRPERASLTLEGLLRDRMPPLEDLIIGGHPSLIGSASAIAAIIGGLFLLYHGLIDYRIPLLVFVTAMAALLVLPVPVVITEAGAEWRWVAMRDPAVGWGLAVTLANYELMAGPLPFVAFFVATSPSIRPMTRRGRTVYAVVVGLLVAGVQLYADVWSGPYVAVLLGSLLTPALDRVFGPRPLV